MKKLVLALSVLAPMAFTAPVHADDISGTWFLRAGIADIDNSKKVSLVVGGQQVPGASLKYHQVYTAMAEIGYNFTEDFSGVLTVGLPPTTSVSGGGTIAPYGKLEGFTYGPSALTVQFQPIHDGFIRPYVGAGISYLLMFNHTSASVQNASLSNDFAPALEVGSEFALTDPFGLFVEVKKAFLTTKASGTIGGYPLTGTKASLDPWVFAVGGTMRF